MAAGTNDELAPVIDEAWRVIHANDLERLAQLVKEQPALLSWHGGGDRAPTRTWLGDGGVLGFATGAYGDCFDPGRERTFTRAACAELLIDAGAVVLPSVCDGILGARARGLLELFHRRQLLPQTLRFFAARGDLAAVVEALEDSDARDVKAAFVCACRFHQEAAAVLLLDQAIAADVELGSYVESIGGRGVFITAFIVNGADREAVEPWPAFIKQRLSLAIREGDRAAFVDGLERSPWLLGQDALALQARLIEEATLSGRDDFITALLDRDPAILRTQPPPSQAIEFAMTYAKAYLLPLLLCIWPLPDDLPHAAGSGDLSRVKRWFDADGRPALGNVANHAPATSIHPREYQWGPVGVQQVLDTALAWSVLNHHFAIADFLLEHGADINTNWNSHEPASILHCLVFEDDYRAMQFLIDRGIDMTITDYRWNATAEGWALYGKNDPEMAEWLEEARRRRDGG